MRSWRLAGVAAPRSSLLERRAESFGWGGGEGLEPLASSVRVISGSPPCPPAFPQVDPDRQERG
jgi:hypothetical protein